VEPGTPGARASRPDKRRPAVSREGGKVLRKQVLAAEAEMKRLWQRRAEIDAMLASPQGPAERSIADLLKSRAEIERNLAAVEADWLAASEAFEGSG
jgi:ATP-binding cassette subfamily F protein 3